ncbi:hypothetical protein M3596_16155 [Bacillus subtilis]|uniref:hypothetical protein n=1 Tax=Bacillus subtilis TaxID=1423 RepID=UPI00203FD5F8|nr:hypothetical protein [Bacillus subtilis]MCM3190270.1 hypothetical protein [Bacillus subtilis]
MPFTKELPEWGNAGQRPPQSSIDEGYKPMDHPPADWFNWYQYTAYHALKELQEIGATQDDVSTALKTAKAYTDELAGRRDNPNQVTKAQVGLGNVDNVQQATKTEFNAHNTDLVRHITSTERSNWNAKETTSGAQNKADTAEKNANTYTDQHINDKRNPHGVTKDQVGLSNVDNVKQASKTEFDSHANNKSNPHAVTKAQVGLANVDNVKQAAKTDFDAHTADNVRHITADERTKWNKGQLYKLTQDNGVRILIPDGTDLLTLPPGFYYGINNRLLNNPDPNDVGWFNYDIMDGNSGRKTIIATASYNNKMWFATIHTNGDFRGWKRILTSTDFEPVWTEVPLKNGAKHGARKVMCATVGGLLYLQGEIVTNRGVIFGTLPASYRPAQLRSRIVPIFGTTGMTKLYIEDNGNMRLEGQISDKLENITSYGLDEIIPL